MRYLVVSMLRRVDAPRFEIPKDAKRVLVTLSSARSQRQHHPV